MPGKWQGSDRRERLPDDWDELCRIIHARSGYRCEFTLPSGIRCPRKADGGVDHIKRGDDHRIGNLRDSCKHHHGRKSSEEGNQAREDISALKLRPAETSLLPNRRNKR